MRPVLLLLCCLAGLAALDLRPLAGPDAPLYKARQERILAQWQALLVDGYAKHGVHGAWDEGLNRLLAHVAQVKAGLPGTMPPPEAAALATQLAAPGACPDPLAAWCAHALAQGRKPRWAAGQQALRAFDADAARRPAAARHARILESIVAAPLLEAYGRTPKPEDRPKALALATRVAGAVGDAIRNDECALFPPVLIAHVRDIDLNHQDFGEPIRTAIDEAVAAAKPAPWIGNALRGTIRIANAWAWRGSGWANTVTKEGWEGFERNLKEADALLTESWQANPGDPLAPAFGCTLAGAGNSATPMETWFLRAAKACFDQSSAFDTMLNFLKPRWGGSYERMLELGCDCLDTRRFDTGVPWRLIYTVQEAIRDAEQMKGQADLRKALGDPRVQAAVETCLGGTLAKRPEQKPRLACIRAAIHWQAGREALARAALAGLAEADLDAGVARDFRVDLKAIKGVAPAPAPAPAPTPDF